MKVKLRTTIAGPLGCFQMGEVVELPDETARQLLKDGAAEPIGARMRIEQAAARDIPIMEKREIKTKPVKIKAKE